MRHFHIERFKDLYDTALLVYIFSSFQIYGNNHLSTRYSYDYSSEIDCYVLKENQLALVILLRFLFCFFLHTAIALPAMVLNHKMIKTDIVAYHRNSLGNLSVPMILFMEHVQLRSLVVCKLKMPFKMIKCGQIVSYFIAFLVSLISL